MTDTRVACRRERAWRLVALCVASLLTVAPARMRAQSAQALIDSAAQARASFRAAGQAATARETLPHLLRAARAWPTQPAYWTAAARMGARASDTGVVIEALNALAEMHGGASLLSDTAVGRLAKAPPVDRALARVANNSATLASGRVVGTLTDSTVFAEGIDADPRTDALYVAGIRHGTIYEIRPTGGVRDLNVSRAPRIGAILGVRVARDGRTLYATTGGLAMMTGYSAADSSLAAVVRVRIDDGAVEARWDIPVDGARHLLGDLAIAEDGTVYASDSFAPVIYRLRTHADSLEQIRHPLFRSLQGVAVLPGGAQLIVADYSHGLLRVDLSTNQVTRIVDAPGTTSLGIDGIIWHDGEIIAVQNGIEPARVARFVLDAARERVLRVDDLDRQPQIADEPTIGTLWRGGFVYVANSQWEKYDDARRRPNTVLRPTLLLCVPLTPTMRSAGNGQTTNATPRKGTRNTASAPPSARTCSVSDAESP